VKNPGGGETEGPERHSSARGVINYLKEELK